MAILAKRIRGVIRYLRKRVNFLSQNANYPPKGIITFHFKKYSVLEGRYAHQELYLRRIKHEGD